MKITVSREIDVPVGVWSAGLTDLFTEGETLDIGSVEERLKRVVDRECPGDVAVAVDMLNILHTLGREIASPMALLPSRSLLTQCLGRGEMTLTTIREWAEAGLAYHQADSSDEVMGDKALAIRLVAECEKLWAEHGLGDDDTIDLRYGSMVRIDFDGNQITVMV